MTTLTVLLCPLCEVPCVNRPGLCTHETALMQISATEVRFVQRDGSPPSAQPAGQASGQAAGWGAQQPQLQQASQPASHCSACRLCHNHNAAVSLSPLSCDAPMLSSVLAHVHVLVFTCGTLWCVSSRSGIKSILLQSVCIMSLMPGLVQSLAPVVQSVGFAIVPVV